MTIMGFKAYIEDYLKTSEPYQPDVLVLDGLRTSESISDVLEIIKSIGGELKVDDASLNIFFEELKIPFQFRQNLFQLRYEVLKNENMRITKID